MATDISALSRAKAVTPGGSQTASRQHGLMGPFGYPAFATSATGTYITFDDGSVAIDLAGANATVPLGYNHPRVVHAIEQQLGGGGSLSLPTHLEAEASERLISLLPFPAMVRWVKTGSEAVSGAVAIAQDITKRKAVAVFEGAYHGWHPWTRNTVTLMPEQSEDAWPSLTKFACVLVESPRWHLVGDDYTERLTRLRTACEKSGTLLIYDDVVYGFRYHNAGLQGTTNVPPDLACFSKALGNGMAVGCIAGEPSIMKQTSFRVSSTFGGETLGLSAANAVLEIHQEHDVCADLLKLGLTLESNLKQALKDTPISITGTPQHFRFKADSPESFDRFLQLCIGSDDDELRVNEGAERVLIHRDANNVNLAMTPATCLAVCHTVSLAAQQVRAEDD